MSKLFVQLLLSMLIGVGAAVGLRSDVRGELNKTLRAAKVHINEKVTIALDDVATQANTTVSISAKASAKASTKSNLQADGKVKGGLDTQVTTGGALLDNLAPGVSVDSSLNTNSQVNAGADMQGLNLDLKNKIKSTLDFGLDTGN